MNLFNRFRRHVVDIVNDLADGGLIAPPPDSSRISVDPPREEAHGDITTNAAMVLARAVSMKPRDLAELLAERLENLPDVSEVRIAGPGFINMRLDDDFWLARLAEILETGVSYGDSETGDGKAVNVEYVSANPTGPMHVGHGRGAVFGDALASLLEKAGYSVTREYYVNDAGAQVDALARSVHLRYRQALGEDIGEIPDGLYPGEYLIEAGRELARRDAGKWLDQPEESWLEPVRLFAVEAMIELIRKDLEHAGIRHDVFTSERSLVELGGVDRAMQFMADHDLTYTGVLPPPKGGKQDDWEPREQLLFRSTMFGDDVDRPLMKSDGSWTYFATDIAYHMDKFNRGFGTMIDIWGADHGGYVKRMRAAVKAVTEGSGELDVKLCQMVNLMDGGKPVKMSKRSGSFITLREVIDRVGRDVLRFIMLTRSNDAHLDFDLTKVSEQSRDNPVFYVQYAHARIHSVLRHAAEIFEPAELEPAALAKASLKCLKDPSELALIKIMAAWPRLVESAAVEHEPHRIAYYMAELAAGFHGLWNKGKDDAQLRFIIADDREITLARLALIRGVALVIASGLDVFGVVPVEEMR